MKPDLLRDSLKRMMFTAIGLILVSSIWSQRPNAVSQVDSVPIGFRVQPRMACGPNDEKCHQDITGIHAAFARPDRTYWHEETKRWEHWDTFRFKNAPLNQDSGEWSVSFAGWLRDGVHGVFSSGHKHEPLPRSEPVIATASSVNLRPTLERGKEYPGWGGDFAPLQVVYEPGSAKIGKYLFFDQTSKDAKAVMKNFWAVNADGTVTTLSMTDDPKHPRPYVAGSEGCSVSPNGRNLVCQSPTSGTTPGGYHNCWAMFTKDLITGGESCVTDEYGHPLVIEKTIPAWGAVGFWSPDSLGFAYYAMNGNDYWLSYYVMKTGDPKTGESVRMTKVGIIPSKFCYDHQDLNCKTQQSGLAWSKDNRLFFSMIEKNGNPRRPTLGSVQWSWKCVSSGSALCPFVPLEKMDVHACAPENGRASPSGQWVAFTSPTSRNCLGPNNLFAHNAITGQNVQLTRFDSADKEKREVSEPYWRSYYDVPSENQRDSNH